MALKRNSGRRDGTDPENPARVYADGEYLEFPSLPVLIDEMKNSIVHNVKATY